MGSCIQKKKPKINPVTSSQSFHFDRSRFRKGCLIGVGAYGKVYEYLNLDSGTFLAVKHMKLEGSQEQIQREVTNLKEEIKIFQKLSHENIIQYLYIDIDEDYSGVDIIMELISGGSLRLLLNKFGKFEERMAALYLAQVLKGLDYLHNEGIVHRDIKPANILVSQTGTIKLSDFGASKKINAQCLDQVELCNSLKGSPYWMAPEIAKRTGHSYPADVWSVGCVAIEMLSGKAPWSSVTSSGKEVLDLIIADQKPELPSEISADCSDFINQCLQINPQNRPTPKQLLDHIFLKLS